MNDSTFPMPLDDLEDVRKHLARNKILMDAITERVQQLDARGRVILSSTEVLQAQQQSLRDAVEVNTHLTNQMREASAAARAKQMEMAETQATASKEQAKVQQEVISRISKNAQVLDDLHDMYAGGRVMRKFLGWVAALVLPISAVIALVATVKHWFG